MQKEPVLIVFGGLPGTGKTSLSRALSKRLQAVYLRIDTIEQALERSGSMKVGNEGYLVAYEVAADNLRAGNIVVADSVNPIPVTRDAWRDIATQNGARVVEIEVICSDEAEHKKRVETRKADIPGHKMPTWQEVVNREYNNWESKNITVDTSKQTMEECLKNLVRQLKSLLDTNATNKPDERRRSPF